MMRLMLDTNIWLDYFIPERRGHAQAFQLIHRCIRGDVGLLTAVGVLKDLNYLLQLDQKSWLRAQGVEVGEQEALVAKEEALACTQLVLDNCTLVCGSANDARMALKLNSVHPDFEDNLVVVAALNAKADMLVSNDEALVRHCAAPALGCADAIAWLEARIG